MMKKLMLWAIVICALFGLVACSWSGVSHNPPDSDTQEEEDVSITLWTYPVGSWGNATTVANLLAAFRKKYPRIHITVEYLDYKTGDDRIEQALKEGNAPDLVFEGPERLVSNWGSRGLMADLSDLWDMDPAGEIYDSVRQACQSRDGVFYEFPICMTTHCMAINYDMFQEAGALQYLDEKTHTWTTDGFVQAVNALTAYGQEKVGVIYCGGQGGDQGTRALVNNLYGGEFTNAQHTAYTFNSQENVQALQLLYDLEGIDFNSDIVGSDEVAQFCKKELAMAFCWNVSMEINQTVTNPDLDFDIFPMAFPTDSGKPRLQGGIWGFGVFDNGDEARIEAAKLLITFMAGSKEAYTRAVLASTHRPVRDMDNIYANDEVMNEYGIFTQYMGDYYQVTPGWTNARTAWWNMLQEIGNGADIATAVEAFSKEANQGLAGE